MAEQRYGLLIDYEYCTGCHACEIACKAEHGFPAGQWGIKVLEFGPEFSITGKPMLYYIPFPTDNCDLCAERVSKGLQPFCVKHCLASCMKFGPLEELVKEAAKKPKTVVWFPK